MLTKHAPTIGSKTTFQFQALEEFLVKYFKDCGYEARLQSSDHPTQGDLVVSMSPLSYHTIEVKGCRKLAHTGNLFLEYTQHNSGDGWINKSDADFVYYFSLNKASPETLVYVFPLAWARAKLSEWRAKYKVAKAYYKYNEKAKTTESEGVCVPFKEFLGFPCSRTIISLPKELLNSLCSG